MRRKSVDKRLHAIAKVQAILHATRDQLDHHLTRRPAAPCGATFSYRSVLDHLNGELVVVEHRLAETEDAYADDRLRPSCLRQQRDEAASDLYDHQHPTHRLLVSLYRDRRHAALTRPTPRAAPALARQVRVTLSLLRHLECHPPASIAGVEINPPALANALKPRLEKLEALCDALIAACVAVDASRERADLAIATADRVVTWVAHSLEGLYRLAGLDELADRIRVCVRR